jgi:hypothetical protein
MYQYKTLYFRITKQEFELIKKIDEGRNFSINSVCAFRIGNEDMMEQQKSRICNTKKDF